MTKENQPSLAQQRKDDHVNLALEQQSKLQTSAFDDIRFMHHSFSDVKFDQIDTSTQWANTTHRFPFYINGMTGGSTYTKQFNDSLSKLAHETGLAMASGSVSVALKEPEVRDSFTIIRKNNPNGFVMANLGAHHDLENAKRAVDLLEANALQIHLNTPQEVVMPEGDRDFSTWKENIQQIVEGLDVPVIVKEVGFGMSKETMEELISLGVKNIDVSGRGGTNFVNIENDRRDTIDFSLLGEWGQTTPESLLESLSLQKEVNILASGGVRSFYDIVKALALGAKATGLSGKLLQTVHLEGVDAATQIVLDWEKAIKHMLLLLNCHNIQELQETQLLLSGPLREYAELRKIDYKYLARR